MNRTMTILATGFLMLQGGMANAQTEKNGEVSEIIIHQNGGQEKKITVIIDGDDVMINGKPMNEFNENGINIRRRKMMINEGEPFRFRGHGMINGKRFDLNGDDGEQQINKKLIVKQDSITFLGVKTELSMSGGAKVTEVVPGSAAEAAGLQNGDIITGVNKAIIDGPETLSNLIKGYKDKDKVEISYLRNNKKRKTDAVLQSKVTSYQTMIIAEKNEIDLSSEDNGKANENRFDIELGGIFPELEKKFKDLNIDVKLFPNKQKLGLKIQDTENEKGVLVLDVADSSLAAFAGLQKGDIITQIDGQVILNTDEARMKLHETEGKQSFFIKILRKNKEMQLEIKIPKPLKVADL